MRRPRLPALLVLAVVALTLTGLLAPGAALAVTDCPDMSATSWVNAAGGSWSDSANWSNGVPNGGCTASITLAGTYVVVVPGGSAAALTLGGPSGTQTLQIAGTSGPTDALFSLGSGGMTITAHGALEYTAIGAGAGGSTSTGPGTITNSGLIETTGGGTAGNRDIQNNIDNSAGGTIAFHADTNTCACGNTHTWNNSGTIVSDPGTFTGLTGTAGGVILNLLAGTVTNNGRIVDYGTIHHTGGTTTGNPVEECGNLDAPGAGVASFAFTAQPGCGNGGGSITGDIGASTSVLIDNTSTTNALTISLNNGDVTNNGTLTLSGVTGAAEDQTTGGGHLANAGTLSVTLPGSNQVQNQLTNTGTVSVAHASTLHAYRFFQQAGTTTTAAGGTFYTNQDVDLTGGTIANAGSFISNGGTITHTGGNVTGNPIEVQGSTIAAPGPGTASFDVTTGSSGISNVLGAGDTVTLDAPGTSTIDVFLSSPFTNHGTVRVAGAGTNQLHGNDVTSDGTFDFTGTGSGNMALNLANAGTVLVESGANANFGYAFDQSAGTTRVDGALNLTDAFGVSGGTLQGTGTINAPAGVQNTGGTVHPGDSPGVLSITGDYTQSAGGTLALDVTGATAGTGYSQLTVSGAASLAGTLHVATSSPLTGTLNVLTAASRTGTFSSTTFDGQTWSPVYKATGVDLGGTAPPANSAPPAITGSATVGSVLSASGGTWSGDPAYAYAWQRCDGAGAGCADIAGATAATYTVVAADAGRTLRVRVTATNAGGSVDATSASTAVVPTPVITPPPPPPGAKLAITGARLSAAKIVQGHAATLLVTLSKAAAVRIAVSHRVKGRRVHGHCKPGARTGKRCTAAVTVARTALTGAAGLNKIRLALVKRLKPGRYVITLAATDSTGLTVVRRLTLTVRRR